MIYLDNAATSWPKPESVYETLNTFLRTAGANPGRAGHRMAVEAADVVSRTRQSLSRLMNAESPERVVFTSNATDALNLAIRGLLRPGDHAITTSMEHNSVIRPLRQHERDGGELTIVRANPLGTVDPRASYEFLVTKSSPGRTATMSRVYFEKAAARRKRIYQDVADTCAAIRKKSGNCSVTTLSVASRLDRGTPMARLSAAAAYASLVPVSDITASTR